MSAVMSDPGPITARDTSWSETRARFLERQPRGWEGFRVGPESGLSEGWFDALNRAGSIAKGSSRVDEPVFLRSLAGLTRPRRMETLYHRANPDFPDRAACSSLVALVPIGEMRSKVPSQLCTQPACAKPVPA